MHRTSQQKQRRHPGRVLPVWGLVPVLFLAGACRQDQAAADAPPAGVTAAVSTGSPAGGKLARQVDVARLGEVFAALNRLAPRPPESKELAACRAFIMEKLRADGLSVREEPFRALTPVGAFQMANVIGEKPGHTGRIVYLATHIDTKRIPGIRFVGANDSSSSTAAVLELARVLAAANTRHTYRFAFFDGEEALGQNITDTDGLYGSRAHARELEQRRESGQVQAFILLDMIGDKDLSLVDDQYSSGELRSLLADCCRQSGDTAMLGGSSSAMVDDHVPFRELGIPVLDIIDFDYGYGNSYWHTSQDVPENVSVDSIARVTRAVLCMVEYFETE